MKHACLAFALLVTFAAPAHAAGIVWTGELPANGGREVALLVPPAANLDKPIELVVFFHGANSNGPDTASWLGPFISKFPAKGRNAVVAFPSGPNNADWMAPEADEGLPALQDQVVHALADQAAHSIKVGSYTVAGFSAGGRPIATAAKAKQLRATRIDLFDCTYGDWGDTILAGRSPGAAINVYCSNATAKGGQRLKGKPNVRYTFAPIEHLDVPERYLAP